MATFAAMIHTEADILVIDEALAVGDEAFQKKCLTKLSEYLDSRDKILLFVSHDISQIERICQRAIWIKDGQVAKDGMASNVCIAYQE